MNFTVSINIDVPASDAEEAIAIMKKNLPECQFFKDNNINFECKIDWEKEDNSHIQDNSYHNEFKKQKISNEMFETLCLIVKHSGFHTTIRQAIKGMQLTCSKLMNDEANSLNSDENGRNLVWINNIKQLEDYGVKFGFRTNIWCLACNFARYEKSFQKTMAKILKDIL